MKKKVSLAMEDSPFEERNEMNKIFIFPTLPLHRLLLLIMELFEPFIMAEIKIDGYLFVMSQKRFVFHAYLLLLFSHSILLSNGCL